MTNRSNFNFDAQTRSILDQLGAGLRDTRDLSMFVCDRLDGPPCDYHQGLWDGAAEFIDYLGEIMGEVLKRPAVPAIVLNSFTTVQAIGVIWLETSQDLSPEPETGDGTWRG